MEPRPPASDTATTRSGVSLPPAMGAWITGKVMPRRVMKGV